MPCSCGKGAECKCIKKKRSKKGLFDETSTICVLCKLPLPVDILQDEKTSENWQDEICTCFISFMDCSSEAVGQPTNTSVPNVDPLTSGAAASDSKVTESEKDSWERKHSPEQSNSSDLYAVSSGESGENINRWRDVAVKKEESLSSGTPSEEEVTKPKPLSYSSQSKNVIIPNKRTGEELNKTVDVSSISTEPAKMGPSTSQLSDESANNNRGKNELDNSSSLNVGKKVSSSNWRVPQGRMAFWQEQAIDLSIQNMNPNYRHSYPQLPPVPQLYPVIPGPPVMMGCISTVPIIPVFNPRIFPYRPRESYYFPPQNILVNPQLRPQNLAIAEGSRPGNNPINRSIEKVQNWIDTIGSSPDNLNVIQPVSDHEADEQARRSPINRRLSYSSTTDESMNNPRLTEQRLPKTPKRRQRRKLTKKEADKFNKKK